MLHFLSGEVGTSTTGMSSLAEYLRYTKLQSINQSIYWKMLEIYILWKIAVIKNWQENKLWEKNMNAVKNVSWSNTYTAFSIIMTQRQSQTYCFLYIWSLKWSFWWLSNFILVSFRPLCLYIQFFSPFYLPGLYFFVCDCFSTPYFHFVLFWSRSYHILQQS